ncbi:DUF4412 domain-containing protein [Pontimicrobium sp. MEBiC01747]
MKKVFTLLALSLTVMVSAQKKITEGVIVSKQTMSSDNEQVKAQLEMMGAMETTTYFKNDKTRSELSNPMSGDVVTVSNAESVLVLMDNPMLGKKYMLQNVKEAEKQVQDIQVTPGTETKTILGYECKQYTVVLKQDAGNVEMEMYTTEDIPARSQQTSMVAEKVKGFPLYVVMKMSQMGTNMVITTEVTDIKKETVADDKFNMTPPEGYEKKDGQ